MNHSNHSNYTSHNDVWLLLPWHVNGSLDENERPLVEGHLKVCVSCRIEVENLTKLAAEMAYSGTVELAASSSFSHLKKQIQANAEPAHLGEMNNSLSWIVGWLTNRPLLVATPLTFLVIVTAMTFFWQYKTIPVGPDAEYYTLSNGAAFKSEHKAIQVEFTETVTQDRIDQIIASIDGVILDEDDQNHIYHVQVNSNKPSDFKQLVALVIQLQEQSDVVSAFPIVVSPPQNRSNRSAP